MIRNFIRKAFVSLLQGDGTDYPLVQVSYNEIATNAQRMSVYGISSQPPRNSLAMLLSPMGHTDDPVAIIDDVINRFKPLTEGEVQVGNYITKSSVYFRKDGAIAIDIPGSGNIEITTGSGGITIDVGGAAGVTVNSAGNVALTCPLMSLNGNLAVTGSITATVDVQAGVNSTSLIGHTHNETGTGGGVTGPPNP